MDISKAIQTIEYMLSRQPYNDDQQKALETALDFLKIDSEVSATIKERAKEWSKHYCTKDRRNITHIAYEVGATEQRKIDYWKARKAFCRTTCGKECPLKDDIEGGGGMVVDCVKLEYFIKAMED